MDGTECGVCFRHCRLKEGERGFCGARICRDGKVLAENYGRVTALALDPIEKKPLRRFRPGSMILSVGSYGCNLRCPFCQNGAISWTQEALKEGRKANVFSPKELADLCEDTKERGNIGIAFTYNEPLIGYEFVRDTAKLVHERGMACVLVTNGTAEKRILDEILPWIDAMNIDLKGFTDDWYGKKLGGNRQQVMEFIETAAAACHVELTTLIVPGENDSGEEMRELSRWVASIQNVQGGVSGEEIPLHVTRFFPRLAMTDRGPTDPARVLRLADVARENLRHVYTGNL